MLIIIFIKSLLFFIFYFFNFFIFMLFLFISIFVFNKKLISNIIRIWSRSNIYFLKFICGIDYKVKTSEKFNENEIYLMLMKHESTWETYFFYQYFKKSPTPVAKKELLYIPVFGQMLLLIGAIFVDRSSGMSSIKKIIKKSKYNFLEKQKSIIMAPQGTRVPVGKTSKEYPYKSGFVAIAQSCNVPILPIVLDSGKCWPKGSFLKYSGTINVSILDPIPVNIIKQRSKDELTKLIENLMEEERNKMR